MSSHSFDLVSLFLTLFSLVCSGLARESAWNGYITPSSTKPQVFTPYYHAPGTKSYNSRSPLIHYLGNWETVFASRLPGKSARSTSDLGATVSFTFSGTGIEWYGNCDRSHGSAEVFIDGQPVSSVSTHCDSATPRLGQRLYEKYDLEHGRPHTIKIVNSDLKIDVSAFIVIPGSGATAKFKSRAISTPEIASTPSSNHEQMRSTSYTWTLTQKGATGVHAMQIAIVSEKHALIVDKVEHNPLTIDGHPAWATLYNLETHSLTPLRVQSNSFCAGGSFLGNGTLVNVGGNPVVEDYTSAADFGDMDGLQAVRLFHPCDADGGDCLLYENHARIRMASPRWYNTVLRISDGSAMIIGGSKKGGWINNATVNNPTIEYYPPKSIHGSNGLPIDLPFLVDTLGSNLFPHAFLLPDGRIFMAANRDAMIYDWKANSEVRLPQIPNGVRVTYPMAGSALLLPLTPENNYTPEVLLCGGSTVDDTKPGYEISSQDPASSQLARLVLTDDGIRAGWQVEKMPNARIMPDLILLPTGQVIIVNGGGTGISGYGNVRNQVGASNADHPVLTPTLYNPGAPAGQRFSQDGMPTSNIARLYHSVATLTPGGELMITGSNPNLDRSEKKYGTEYRVEWLRPPYMDTARPEITNCKKFLGYGESISIDIQTLKQGADVKVALMDLGYVTHAVHANSRLVYLEIDGQKNNQVQVRGPPDNGIYPPGPAWLYVLQDGIPSKAVKIMVGDGSGPPVDEQAIENLLKSTSADQYDSQNHS